MADICEIANAGADIFVDPAGRFAKEMAASDIGNPKIRGNYEPNDPGCIDEDGKVDIRTAGQTGKKLAIAGKHLKGFIRNGIKIGPAAVFTFLIRTGVIVGDIQDAHKAIIERLEKQKIPGFQTIPHNNGEKSWVDASGSQYEDGYETRYNTVQSNVPDRDDRQNHEQTIGELRRQEDIALVVEAQAIAELLKAGFTLKEYTELVYDAIYFDESYFSNTEKKAINIKQLEEHGILGVSYQSFEINGIRIDVIVDGYYSLIEDDSLIDDIWLGVEHTLKPEHLDILGPKAYLEAKQKIEQLGEIAKTKVKIEIGTLRSQNIDPDEYDDMRQAIIGPTEHAPVPKARTTTQANLGMQASAN